MPCSPIFTLPGLTGLQVSVHTLFSSTTRPVNSGRQVDRSTYMENVVDEAYMAYNKALWVRRSLFQLLQDGG